ncbi:MAG: hypothetical protein LBH76_07255 [Propionibacteriaceae bacterium]|nr:hypothetical protein [Propionibacteriaceae bacterium]
MATLKAAMAELDHVAYVYKDYGDGLNLYTQRAWMGSHYPDESLGESPPDALDEQAEPFSGVTSVHARIDLKRFGWGGWQFQIGALDRGETVPELNFGDQAPGFDLSGAARLTFQARGTPGALVDFSVGGLGRWGGVFPGQPYHDTLIRHDLRVRLADEWTSYEIDLTGADLRQVGAGFALSAGSGNRVRGLAAVDVYVDEIRFEWDLPGLRPLWLRSYTPQPPTAPGAFINNFSFVYDQAMAIIALTEAGELHRARQLADAVVWAQAHERTYQDGRIRNAYANGAGISPPGWQSGQGEMYVPSPGYYVDGVWLEDYYADSTSTGVAAWVILALTRLYADLPGHSGYRDTALRLGRWVLDRQAEHGFTGGPEGFDGAQTEATYASTEHNADLVTAFARLAAVAPDAAEAARFEAASRHAADFVRSMLVTGDGAPYFATGTQADGVTPNTEVIPLDTQTWTLLALGPDTVPEAAAIMAGLERFAIPGGGYDFNTDCDGAWLEGTGQVAVLRQVMSDPGAAADLAYIDSQRLADGFIPSAAVDGITTGFDVSGLDMPWVYSHRGHVGATAWAALAEMGVNPLAP